MLEDKWFRVYRPMAFTYTPFFRCKVHTGTDCGICLTQKPAENWLLPCGQMLNGQLIAGVLIVRPGLRGRENTMHISVLQLNKKHNGSETELQPIRHKYTINVFDRV